MYEHRYDEAYEENNKFPHKTTEIRKPFARCQGCKVPNTKPIRALSMSYVDLRCFSNKYNMN